MNVILRPTAGRRAARCGAALGALASLLLAGCATPVTAPSAPTAAAPALTACPEGVPAGARCWR
ncbi:MAG: chitinase, partial [Betaproteobacteria bacterium]